MLHVVDHGTDASDPDVQRVRRLLVGTVDEALGGLPDRDRRKLRTRLDRTMWTFLAPIVAMDGQVDVVGLIRLARARRGARCRDSGASRGHAAVRRAGRDSAGAGAGRGRSYRARLRRDGVARRAGAPAGARALRQGSRDQQRRSTATRSRCGVVVLSCHGASVPSGSPGDPAKFDTAAAPVRSCPDMQFLVASMGTMREATRVAILASGSVH